MKANELRIGNYILDNDGIISKINGFKPFEHSVRCDELEGCIVLIDVLDRNKWSEGWATANVNIKPIELTEEILLKCGFELKGIIFRINNGFDNQFDINYSLSRDMFYYDSSKHGIYKEVEIKYLHELQNLYFALTNEELTIKL